MSDRIRRPPDDIDLEDEDTLPAEGQDIDDIPAVTPDADVDEDD
jgi:DNA polymerase II small subunit/DNA polymerase delta subunit B